MSKLIRGGETFQIPSMMQVGKNVGMVTSGPNPLNPVNAVNLLFGPCRSTVPWSVNLPYGPVRPPCPGGE